MNVRYICLLLTLAWAMTACSTVTKISTAWKAPDYEGGAFRKPLIIGVSKEDLTRRTFEDAFAQALGSQVVLAKSSYHVLPDSDRLTEVEIKQAVQQGDYDAVIITRLLAVDKKETYVPPRTYTMPRYYYAYYNYYHTAWDVVHEPGYVKTDTIVRLQTNLYDVRTERLVWSGQSDTFDPPSTKDVVTSVTRAVTQRLTKEGLIGR